MKEPATIKAAAPTNAVLLWMRTFMDCFVASLLAMTGEGCHCERSEAIQFVQT